MDHNATPDGVARTKTRRVSGGAHDAATVTSLVMHARVAVVAVLAAIGLALAGAIVQALTPQR